MERRLARGHIRVGVCLASAEGGVGVIRSKGCSRGSRMEWWDGEAGSYFGLIARGWRIAGRGEHKRRVTCQIISCDKEDLRGFSEVQYGTRVLHSGSWNYHIIHVLREKM